MVTNATREGRKLHGHMVSGLARVSLPRSGLSTTVTVLPLEDRQAQRCSSLVTTAQELRPVAQGHRCRVVDELNATVQLHSRGNFLRVPSTRESRNNFRDRHPRTGLVSSMRQCVKATRGHATLSPRNNMSKIIAYNLISDYTVTYTVHSETTAFASIFRFRITEIGWYLQPWDMFLRLKIHLLDKEVIALPNPGFEEPLVGGRKKIEREGKRKERGSRKHPFPGLNFWFSHVRHK